MGVDVSSEETTDFGWLARGMENDMPFPSLIGVRVKELTRGHAVLELPDDPKVHNHVGGAHAGALFGLGESAAALAVITTFADLLGEHVPLVKGAEIAYASLLTGPAYAEANFTADEAGARESIGARGRATFPVEIVFRDASGAETARMTAQMAMKKLDSDLQSTGAFPAQ
jgi:acyl-coenzyme A thioesterase PaaI-like protein